MQPSMACLSSRHARTLATHVGTTSQRSAQVASRYRTNRRALWVCPTSSVAHVLPTVTLADTTTRIRSNASCVPQPVSSVRTQQPSAPLVERRATLTSMMASAFLIALMVTLEISLRTNASNVLILASHVKRLFQPALAVTRPQLCPSSTERPVSTLARPRSQ